MVLRVPIESEGNYGGRDRTFPFETTAIVSPHRHFRFSNPVRSAIPPFRQLYLKILVMNNALMQKLYNVFKLFKHWVHM